MVAARRPAATPHRSKADASQTVGEPEPHPGSVAFDAPAGRIPAQATGQLATARHQMITAAVRCLRLAVLLEPEQLIAYGLEAAAALLKLAEARAGGGYEDFELAARRLASAVTTSGARDFNAGQEPDCVVYLAAVEILRTRVIMLDTMITAGRASSLVTFGDARRVLEIAPPPPGP